MTGPAVPELLEARAPGAWELYRKEGASREIVHSGAERCESARREEGLAARWWDPAPRFAAAGSEAELARILPMAAEALASPGEAPQWPSGAARTPEQAAALDPPPDLFEELARLVSAESRGEASLRHLSVRRGRSVERVVNAGGLDVAWASEALTGFAEAVGRRGARACEARTLFRWEGEPDLAGLARRLSDRATLPLCDRASPVDRGEWLLDVSVGAALLAGLAPLFAGDGHPPWAARGKLLPAEISIVDDATRDAPFDGEGTKSHRVVVVSGGALRARLHDLASARRAGAASTGHGVRRSYRTPPVRAARRIFFETERPVPPRELLASVRRGLFASALTAPLFCDLEKDRYEAQFTGIAVVAGRAQGPVAEARVRGRLSELLRRIAALCPDPGSFPMPDPVGGATLLVERVSFE
ncbi:MAG: metallopeptidase TldD-related protein [Acidobacteriota bacterium]